MINLDVSIVIVGKIRSGKSTFAKSISKCLNFPIASFGEYLVDYSKQKNLPIHREVLQNLGNDLVREDSSDFLNKVVSYNGSPNKVIFEGVRHKTIFDEIKNISEKSFAIYLDINEEIRLQRFIQQEKEIDLKSNAINDFYERNNHQVEQEIE